MKPRTRIALLCGDLVLACFAVLIFMHAKSHVMSGDTGNGASGWAVAIAVNAAAVLLSTAVFFPKAAHKPNKKRSS